MVTANKIRKTEIQIIRTKIGQNQLTISGSFCVGIKYIGILTSLASSFETPDGCTRPLALNLSASSIDASVETLPPQQNPNIANSVTPSFL